MLLSEAKPFTRVPGHPTREVRDRMYEKAWDVAITFNLWYQWKGEFVLLAIVTGENKYMSLANKVYVDPTEPTAYNSLVNQGTRDYQSVGNLV